jgi:hypothetical protein
MNPQKDKTLRLTTTTYFQKSAKLKMAYNSSCLNTPLIRPDPYRDETFLLRREIKGDVGKRKPHN